MVYGMPKKMVEWTPSPFERALMAALRGVLAERGYTVERAASEMGISRNSLGMYLRLEREMGLGALTTLCAVLRVDRTALVARAEASVEQGPPTSGDSRAV